MAKIKEIMNTKEVSEFLKLHPFTVNKMAREGKIPAFKIGVDWRFHRRHIERWINEKIAYNQSGKDRRKSRMSPQQELWEQEKRGNQENAQTKE